MRSAGKSILAASLFIGLGCGGGEEDSGRGQQKMSVAPPTVIAGAAGTGSTATTTPPPVSRPAQPTPITPPTPGSMMTGVPPAPPPGTPPAGPPVGAPAPPAPPPPGAPTEMPPGPPAAPAPAGATDPVVPMITETCPPFRDSTITFMGLPGIQMVAGRKAAGPTAPMVFYWHGTGSFAGEFALMASAVQAGVVAEGGVLISFDGTTGGDLSSGTFVFGAGDLNLADQLFACAVKEHNVDPRRVFATGCSAGGLFATAQVAARSNYMAAAAPNSGGFPVIGTPFQTKANIPALMTVHGAPGVDVVAIDFSESSAVADAAFKNAGGFVINCNHGGAHCGGGSLSGDMWNFFKAHPFGTKPSPWANGLPAGFNRSCKIF